MIYSYWTGPIPDWIRLCLDSIQRNVPDIQLLSRHLWKRLVGDELGIPWEYFDQQLPNVQSDYIRSWILHHWGGIWVDADAIVFRDLQPLTRCLEPSGFFAYRVPAELGTCTALIGATAGSPLARTYHELMVKRLQEGTVLQPLDLGPRILSQAVQVCGVEPELVDERLIHPIGWNGWGPDRRLTQQKSLLSLCKQIGKKPFCQMLTHQALGSWNQASTAELLRGESYISDCFRYSRGDSQ